MTRPISTADAAALREAIIRVCQAHQLWLSHEDKHGGFEITRTDTTDWLRAAWIEHQFRERD